jgi:outer membrane protein assembly factor BamB
MAKRPASLGVALIFAIGAFLSDSALAQLANSSWPIFRRDAQLTARAQANGPTIPAVKWIARFGNGRLGTPAIGIDGTIYVPGVVDSALYAVAPDNGQVLWIFAGVRGEEFASSPVVGQEGTIYFASSKHILYAVNPDGTEQWRLTLGGEVRVSANIGSDGTIYVTAWDNKLYAITPAGTIKWSADLKGRRSRNGPAIASDGTIYVIADEYLMAFNEKGEFQFEHDCRDISVLSGLMVEGNETVYVTALTTAKIKAISTGNVERWKTFFPNDFGPATMPALGSDGAIYFASVKEGGIFALNHDGSTRWTFTLPGTENLTELSLDAANNVYIVNDSLGLISLGNDGKLRWSLPEVHCAYSPAFGADGTIYIASDKKLYAVGPQTPFAASLINVSGDSQSTCIETPLLPLPIKVRVLDQYGNPFPNQPVNFRILSGGGSVNPPLDSTDNDGFAQTAWTLGNQPGKQELEVSPARAGVLLKGLFTATALAPRISGPPEVLFDLTEIKHASDTTYVFCNNSECVLRIDSVRVLGASDFFVLPTISSLLVSPGQCLSLRLQFKPRDCGTQTATLCIYSNDPEQPKFCVPLRGEALQQPDIELTNNSLDFGKVCRGTDTTLALPIFNRGCADLTITNVTSTNPAFVVIPPLPPVIPAGGQAFLSIKFTPTAVIADTGRLSIFSNDPDENLVTVPLSGSGGEADIDGKKEVVFDTVDVQICAGLNNADTATYVIHNVGSCDLNIDTLFVNLSEFIVPPISHLSIPPGGSLPVPIKFEPKAKGDYVGNLTIVSDDSDEHEFRVTLRGAGNEAPAIALSPPDTLDFDSVSVGFKKLLPVTITNLGAERLCVDSLVIKSKNFAVETQEFCLACNQDTTVDVAFVPDSQGVFIDSLLIYSNDPDGNASKRNMLVMVALGENKKFPMRFASIAKSQDTGTAPIFSSAANEKTPAVLYLRGSGSGPEIEVEPETLDFDSVCVGSVSLRQLTVKNVGDATLRIDTLVFSDSAFYTTKATPFDVLPGDNVPITVTFAPKDTGHIVGTLEIRSNDPHDSVKVVGVRGLVGALIALETTPRDSGKVCVGGTAITELCIVNPSNCVLQIDTIKFKVSPLKSIPLKPLPLGKISSQAQAPFTIPPHGRVCVTFDFDVDETTSDFEVLVRVRSHAANEDPAIRSVRWRIMRPVIAGADSVDFGQVLVNTSKQDTARVRNPSECEVRIDALKITGADSAAFAIRTFTLPHTINAGNVAGIPVIFKPTRKGQHTATLLVYNNDPAHNPLPIVLIGIGTDTICDGPPQIAVNPTALEYGEVPVNNIVSQSLTISNTGCDTLRVTDMSNSLPVIFHVNAADKKFNLARGEQRVVSVFFAPAAEVPYIDTLRIVNNDTSKGTVLVPLNGRGKKPTDSTGYTVNPDSLLFGAVCIGDDSTRLVQICNTGSRSLNAVSISTGRPQFKVDPTGNLLIPIGPDSCRTLTVTFSPTTVSDFQDTITVVWDPSLNLPPLRIPLSGSGIGPRIAGTDTLRFSHVIEKQSLKKFSIVKNIAGCELVISALKMVGKDSLAFAADTTGLPITLAAGESDSIAVTFTPLQPGRFMATLLASNNDSNNNPFPIVLLGEGDKCVPIISVNPAALSFGTAAVLDTLVKTLSVMNTSECETLLHISNITNTLPVFFVNTADRQFNLAPGARRDIKVFFVPTAVSSYHDSLRIASDDPLHPIVVVPLDATGALPHTTPGPVTFPTACVDSRDSLSVTICNTSEHPLFTSSITTTGPQFKVKINALSIPNGADSCGTIEIIFRPDAVRVFHDTLTVVWDPSLNLPPLQVPLSGEGIGPTIAGTDTLRFGHVIERQSLTKFAIVKNIADCELVVSALKVVGKDSLAFAADASGLPITLAAGESDSIAVTFTPPQSGSFRATLLVSNNDSAKNPFPIVLLGEGDECAAVIAVDPEALHFGEVVLGDTLAKTLKVMNTSECETLHVSNIVAHTPEVFFVNLADRQFDLAPGASRDIKVYFAPVAVIFYSDSLMIASDDPTNPLLSVPLSGNGKSPLTFTPDSLLFGKVCLDDHPSLTIKICNTSNGAWSTASIVFLQKRSEFTFDPTSSIDLPAHSCTDTLRVNFAPKVIGVVRDTLKIVWVSAENTNIHVPPMLIPLSGEGVGPQIAGAKEVRFDTTGVSKSDTMKYTIRNDGPCELRIERMTITGTNADEFQRLVPPNTPYTIAPNATSELTLVFTPQALGERRAQLNISNNDPDVSDSLFVVQLIGNAITGVLATACESIDFGKTCADNPVTKECTLINISKIADLEIVSLQLVSGKDFKFADSLALPMILRPQETRTLRIIFEPEKTTGPARDASDTVVVLTKYLEQKQRISLFGHKRSEGPDLVLFTPSLEFWGALGKATPCTSAVIFNEGCSPLVVNDLELAGFTNVFEICSKIPTPFPLAPDQSMAVDVLFKPIDFAEFKDELRIYSDDRDKSPALVELTGRVQIGGICLESDSTKIRLGKVYRNTPVTVRLGVTNCSNPSALLKVEALPLRLKDFTVEPSELPNVTPDTKQFFNVTFKPEETGDRIDTLKLLVTSVFGNGASQRVEVILHGIGIDDEVYALPNAFTPNDDDKNDFAKIHFPGYKMVSPVLRIYDLRGIAVRVLRRPNDRGDIIAWDGYDSESRSRLMPPGAYVWLLEDQGKKVGSGVIVLIR